MAEPVELQSTSGPSRVKPACPTGRRSDPAEECRMHVGALRASRVAVTSHCAGVHGPSSRKKQYDL
eukprot:2563813-Amphidinium_carterae.1